MKTLKDTTVKTSDDKESISQESSVGVRQSNGVVESHSSEKKHIVTRDVSCPERNEAEQGSVSCDLLK